MNKRIQLLQVNLLWEIWHMDKDVPEAEFIHAVQEHAFPEEVKSRLCTITPEQVKQRLFGGFPCGEGVEGYHIIHNTGAYTYLEANVDLTAAERQQYWKQLLNELYASDIEDWSKVDITAPFATDCPLVDFIKAKKFYNLDHLSNLLKEHPNTSIKFDNLVVRWLPGAKRFIAKEGDNITLDSLTLFDLVQRTGFYSDTVKGS